MHKRELWGLDPNPAVKERRDTTFARNRSSDQAVAYRYSVFSISLLEKLCCSHTSQALRRPEPRRVLL